MTKSATCIALFSPVRIHNLTFRQGKYATCTSWLTLIEGSFELIVWWLSRMLSSLDAGHLVGSIRRLSSLFWEHSFGFGSWTILRSVHLRLLFQAEDTCQRASWGVICSEVLDACGFGWHWSWVGLRVLLPMFDHTCLLRVRVLRTLNVFSMFAQGSWVGDLRVC